MSYRILHATLLCFKLQRSITMLVLNHFYKHYLGNSPTTDSNAEDGAHLDVSAESYLGRGQDDGLL